MSATQSLSDEGLTAPSALFGAEHLEGRLFSGGWVDGSERLATLEPATGDTLAEIGAAGEQQVLAGARVAAEAQRGWAAVDPYERADTMLRAAASLERQRSEVADWLVREGGCIPPKADFEIGLAIQELREAAALTSQARGEALPGPDGTISVAARVPVGVVGVITPWNFPLILAMRSVAPALALGNAVILKCDPNTPVSGGFSIARIFEEAGLPEGVLHVLPGGVEAGAALTAAPEVGMVSFTGSTAAGRKVGAACGTNLKRVVLELGGKSAFIVLDDADLDAASSSGAWGSFLHQGQICMASGRHLVHETVADAYLEKLAARAGHLPFGNPATDQARWARSSTMVSGRRSTRSCPRRSGRAHRSSPAARAQRRTSQRPCWPA
jgi:benzaldehyde dehydrogenase (NAD)